MKYENYTKYSSKEKKNYTPRSFLYKTGEQCQLPQVLTFNIILLLFLFYINISLSRYMARNVLKAFTAIYLKRFHVIVFIK